MCGRELRRFGAKEGGWLSWRELAALLVFLALLGGLVFWTTTAVPSPAAELPVDLPTVFATSSIQPAERVAPQEAP